MSSLKVVIVSDNAENLPDWVRDEIAAAGIELVAKKCKNTDELLKYAAGAELIWTRGRNEVITAEILPELKNCKAIMRSGSGLDDIPVEAAKKSDIKVLNTPEAIAPTVAEHTVALLFALARQIPQHDKAVRQNIWLSEETWAKWHVYGQTLGLVGFGLIARHVVKMLKGFDLNFLVFDPYAEELIEEYGLQAVSFERLLTDSDFISLHCPLTRETNRLFGEEQFKLMKNSAFLINTSRGGVIDEQALITALREHWIAGAALDVTDPEPPDADNPLLKLDNVIITPHIAAFSDEFARNFWKVSIEKLKSYHCS
ncbi:MAG: C-terminal binding protein [Victivallales bacterium]